MGLFSSNKAGCDLCGKKYSIANMKFKLDTDHSICTLCTILIAGYSKKFQLALRDLSFEEIQEKYNEKYEEKRQFEEERAVFSADETFGNQLHYFSYDDENKLIEIANGISFPAERFKYSEIEGYEGRQNEQTIIKSGLGKAIVGGIIGGSAGMVTGAVIGKGEKGKDVSDFISVKIFF